MERGVNPVRPAAAPTPRKPAAPPPKSSGFQRFVLQFLLLAIALGGAFGTGGHPTTRLCLAWLASLGVADRSVLDYGCGSGILAIAAKLLGAARVVAVDHDPQALAVTRDNAAVNGVGLEVASNDGFDPGPPFDFVVANILASTLIAEAPRLRSCLAADGRIALCGLLPEQADGVARAYPDVVFEAPRGMEGWVLLAGRRGPPRVA